MKLSPLTVRRSLLTALFLILVAAPFLSGLHNPYHRYAIVTPVFFILLTALFVSPKPTVGAEQAVPASASAVPSIDKCPRRTRNEERGTTNLRITPLLPLATFFILYATGFLRYSSLYGSLDRMLTWSAAIAVFLTIYLLRPTGNELAWLLRLVVLSGLVMAMIGMLVYIGYFEAGIPSASISGQRLNVFMPYSNATACWFMLTYLLAVLYSYVAVHKYEKWLVLSAAPVIGTALILTMSRGAWLSAAVGFAVALAMNYRKPVSLISHISLLFLTTVVLAVSIISSPEPRTILILVAAVVGLMFVFSTLSLAYYRATPVIGVVALLAVGIYTWHTLFQPIVYTASNNTEANAWKVLRFNASGLTPGESYSLSGTINANNLHGSPHAGIISVWAVVDGAAKELLIYQALSHEDPAEQFFTLQPELNFTLPPSIVAVEIHLVNVYPGTSVAWHTPVLSGLGLELPLNNVSYRLLPYSLATRLNDITLSRFTVDGRTTYLQDSYAAFAQALLIGRGGGTWQAVYPGVQSHYYGSSLAHSDTIEVALDTGILGLLAYLAFLAFVLLGRVGAQHAVPTSYTVLPITLAFIVHSFVEALLGFPALHLVFFALLGSIFTVRAPHAAPVISGSRPDAGAGHAVPTPCPCSASTSARSLRAYPRAPVAYRLLALICLLPILALSSSFLAAEVLATDNMPLSLRLNPFHADRRVAWAKQLQAQGGADDIVLSHYLTAHRHEPYSPVYAAALGQHLLSRGEYDEALLYYLKTPDLQPHNIQNYENAAFLAAEIADVHDTVASEGAAVHARKVLALYDRYQQVASRTDPALIHLNKRFELTPSFSVSIGRAYAILGDAETAWYYLVRVAEKTNTTAIRGANKWLGKLFGYVYDPENPTNLLTHNLSHVEHSIFGFSGWRTARFHDTAVAWQGNASIRGEATESGGHGITANIRVKVFASRVYTASVHARHNTERPLYLRIDWFGAEGRLGYTHSRQVPIGEHWERIQATGSAPEGATHATLYLLCASSGVVGDILWADGWMLEAGEKVRDWIPGMFRILD